MNKNCYDLIGIGIGPFNLGLAALSSGISNFNSLFFDAKEEFQWHSGLLLPQARLQVPFYADLVTAVDPTSRYSYLNYLKESKSLFRFAILENYEPTRKEYNQYCQWAAQNLPNLHWGSEVLNIHFSEKERLFSVSVLFKKDGLVRKFLCRNIVIGIGAVPVFPKDMKNVDKKRLCHSGEYLTYKNEILSHNNVTIIGSGQSAAEIFYDLLGEQRHANINWFTRAAQFFPMDVSQFSFELTSLDYIDHFYRLKDTVKKAVLRKHDHLYKGINASLIKSIYEALHLLDKKQCSVKLHPCCEVVGIDGMEEGHEINFWHTEHEEFFSHRAQMLICAIGYQTMVPSFVKGIQSKILWDKEGNYAVKRNYAIDTNDTIFVQNAELHTHGFSAPDLGMGPYRNATILNAILKREIFELEQNVCFQQFGIPVR